MRRVVITGIGLVTPCGVGTDATWAAVKEGRSGIGYVTRFDAAGFPVRIAGEVPGWDASRFLDTKRRRETSPFIELAVGAGALAWDDAGLVALEPTDAQRAGCIVGVGLCGLEPIQAASRMLDQQGPRALSPFSLPATAQSFAPAQIAIRLGLGGVNYAVSCACASGAQAIGDAARLVRYGEADVMVAGGTDAGVTPLAMGTFSAMRALSTRNDTPTAACRPWDGGRDGIVMSEGAGIVVLEELEHARRRGARVYGEILGFGSCNDAFHVTQPGPGGAERAMRLALADARTDGERVGYVNAHATGTLLGDLNESRAIRGVFGAHADRLAVSSTKSMLGHMMGAAGAVELALTALAVHHGVVPPTINLEKPGKGCDLDYVPGAAREVPLAAAMSNAFGFGGANVSLVVGRV